MPLVVLSLTGDASDMFNWTCSVSPGDAQDLSELLQMLREHYCGETWSRTYARGFRRMPLTL